MKKTLSLTVLLCNGIAFSQVGINTETPQKDLHVNGSLQITKELNVGGDASTMGNSGINGQVLISQGNGLPPVWQTLSIPTLPTLATGTVISIDGQLTIAQEITALMTQNATITGAVGTYVPPAIPFLTNEIIDNENKFSASSTTNSFTVSNSGIYQITMNVQLFGVPVGNTPVVGIWCNTDGNWVARVNDASSTTATYTQTLITAIELNESKVYSFRASNTENFTIRAISSGSTGSGPVTFVSLKRLK